MAAVARGQPSASNSSTSRYSRPLAQEAKNFMGILFLALRVFAHLPERHSRESGNPATLVARVSQSHRVPAFAGMTMYRRNRIAMALEKSRSLPDSQPGQQRGERIGGRLDMRGKPVRIVDQLQPCASRVRPVDDLC